MAVRLANDVRVFEYLSYYLTYISKLNITATRCYKYNHIGAETDMNQTSWKFCFLIVIFDHGFLIYYTILTKD